MQPTLVTKPAFAVVGLRIRVKAMSPEIPALWGRFVPRIGEVPYGTEPYVSYGLMDNFDPTAHELDYMAGVSVTRVDHMPAGMTSWNVAAATYAVFATTIPTMRETMGKIHAEWLPKSGHREAAGPHFERYGEKFDPTDPASTFSIYIPVG